MADNNNDFGAFVSGFMIGGLIGAAVALLLAPQSGEETRLMIRDKGIELKDQVETTAGDARVRAEEMAQDARARASDAQQRGQVVLEQQKSRIEEAIEAGKKAAKDTKAGQDSGKAKEAKAGQDSGKAKEAKA
ncbi:MAG: YtxH domain-containing protein [Anaerolineales bacterium]